MAAAAEGETLGMATNTARAAATPSRARQERFCLVSFIVVSFNAAQVFRTFPAYVSGRGKGSCFARSFSRLSNGSTLRTSFFV